MRSILRGLTPRRFRKIAPPRVMDFREALIDRQPSHVVRIEPLVRPRHFTVSALRRPRTNDITGWLADSCPEAESVFEPLRQPEVDGMCYSQAPPLPRDHAVKAGVRRRNGRHFSPGGLAGREGRVVNEFERLRLVLQPPILPRDGRPTVYPNGLRPYPFQIVGVRWLVESQEALLADQMGLGKTIQAIVAMRVLFRRGSLRNALVVCPASMTNVWAREVELWAPELRTMSVQGSPHERPLKWRSHAEIHIVSYETLRNDIDGLSGDRFDLYVLDEAQKIKNPQTKVHHSVRWLTPKYRWALTGTPIENVVDDVVSIFNVLVPGLFPRQNSHGAYRVRQTIQPYVLRRTIDQVNLQLPELTHQDHWLNLHPAQRRTYRRVEREGISEIRGMGSSAVSAKLKLCENANLELTP